MPDTSSECDANHATFTSYPMILAIAIILLIAISCGSSETIVSPPATGGDIGDVAAIPDAEANDEDHTHSTRTSGSPRSDLAEIVAGAQRTMILTERAENKIIKQCMEAQGFEFFGSSDANVGLGFGDVLINDLSEGEATENGYGIYMLTPEEEGPALASRRDGIGYFKSLSTDEQASYLRALEGGGDETAVTIDANGVILTIGMEGCVGDARRELLGDRALDVYEVFTTLQFLPYSDISSYDVVIAAEREWSECMAESGYRFERPRDAVDEGLSLRGDAVGATAPEIDLAMSDAGCRSRSDIGAVVLEALATQNDAVLADNQQLLASWSQMESEVLTRVGEVLGVDLS